MDRDSLEKSIQTGKNICEGRIGLVITERFADLKKRFKDFIKDYEWVLRVNYEMWEKSGGESRYAILHVEHLLGLISDLGLMHEGDKKILDSMSKVHILMLKMAVENTFLTSDDVKLRKLAKHLVEQRCFSVNDLGDEVSYFDEQHVRLLRFKILETVADLKIASDFYERDVLPIIETLRAERIDSCTAYISTN